MILFKHPLRIVALLFSLTLVTSCKKDKDNDDPGSTGGYPKEVNIEYKATTTTSGLTTVGVHYHNETGGLTDNDVAALPFSVKLKRKLTAMRSLYSARQLSKQATSNWISSSTERWLSPKRFPALPM